MKAPYLCLLLLGLLSLHSYLLQAQVPGCTDPAAINTNPMAAHDDDLCVYLPSCDGAYQAVYFHTFISSVPDTSSTLYLINSASGDTLDMTMPGGAAAYFTPANYMTACLHPDSCYYIAVHRSEPMPPLSASNEVAFGDANGWIANMYYGTSLQHYFFTVPNGATGCPVFGCTDPDAMNYQPQATHADSSCTYCNDELLRVSARILGTTSQSWSLTSNGASVAFGSFSNSTTTESYVCLPQGCYELRLSGNSANFVNFTVENSSGDTLVSGAKHAVATAIMPFGIDAPPCFVESEVYGCVNSFASNYNPQATIFDGSCVFNNNECSIEFEFALDTLYGQGIVIHQTYSATDIPFSIFWDFGNGDTPTSIPGWVTLQGDGPFHVCAEMFSFSSNWMSGMDPVVPMCYKKYCASLDPEFFGLSTQDGINLFTDDFLNTEHQDVSASLQLYPNPANGNVYLRTAAMQGELRLLEIYDLQGRKVLSERLSLQAHQEHQVNVSQLRPGMYLIVLSGHGMVSRHKLVVK